MVKVFITALMLIITIASPISADEGCKASDAVVSTGIGAVAGAVAGGAAVWTIAILGAPFTFGSSLAFAATATIPALVLGLKGGAFYGASAEAIDCAKAGKDYLFGD